MAVFAVDDLVVAALCGAGCRDFVFDLCIAQCVCKLLNDLRLSGQFFAAHCAVDDLVVAALCGAGGLHAVFFNRFARGMLRLLDGNRARHGIIINGIIRCELIVHSTVLDLL